MKVKSIVLALLVILVLGFAGVVSAETVIFSDGLENIDPETNLPKGWTVFSNNNGDSGSAAKDIVRSGSYSWFINDPSDVAVLGIRSPLVPAEAGKEYRAASWVYALSGIANLYIEFWDADGTRLGPLSTRTRSHNEWEEISAVKEAPAGTKFVSFILYAQAKIIGSYYFDDTSIMLMN